jgi:hypothetical protein
MGFNQSAKTWVAECAGRRFICTENTTSASSTSSGTSGTFTSSSVDSDVSCRETIDSEESRQSTKEASASRSSTAAPTGEAPRGAAGFQFGQGGVAAKNACEQAGHDWTRVSAGLYSCSGAAQSVGFDAATALDICKKQVCGITIVYKPEAGWVDAIAELKGQLQGKYGAETKKRVQTSPSCSDDEALINCISSGNMHIDYEWNWPTRERLHLLVAEPEPKADGEEEPSIRLIYTRPVTGVKADTSAL